MYFSNQNNVPKLRLILFVAGVLLFLLGVFHQSGYQSPTLSSSLPSSLQHLTGSRDSFYDIAIKYGTDKVTTHQYQFMYEKYMPALRDKRLKMLEIGLGCDMNYGPGASYHTWLEYFPNVDLYYIEYDAACAKKWAAKTSGATIFAGDQADVSFLNDFIAETGGDFDIIIDDGGHSMNQQQVSLEHLWSIVKPGGIYFLEDLQTSFMPSYGGDPTLGKDPEKWTMLKFIYEMIDDKMTPDGPKHPLLTRDMRGIDCQREVCAFFKKEADSI